MEFVFGLLPIFLFIGWIVLWIWCLVDIRRFSPEAWRSAGESKAMWTLAIVVLQFFGTLFYLSSVRAKLQDSEAKLAAGSQNRSRTEHLETTLGTSGVPPGAGAGSN